MIKIRNFTLHEGLVEFEVYVGFGEWKQIKIERTKYGSRMTDIDTILPEEADDDFYYELEDLTDKLSNLVYINVIEDSK